MSNYHFNRHSKNAYLQNECRRITLTDKKKTVTYLGFHLAIAEFKGKVANGLFTFMEVWPHVKVGKREADEVGNLGRERELVAETLQMNAQHFR